MATTKTLPRNRPDDKSLAMSPEHSAWGYTYLESVNDSFKPELKARLDALEHRRRVLTTELFMIARQNGR